MDASPKHALRVRCHDFSIEEVDALRSLMRLLKEYLKQPWTVTDGAVADVVFVNLDNPVVAPDYPGARLVGCAVRPRLHSPGTVHRPFRAAEVLATLSETASVHSHEREPVADDRGEWRYRLRHWPLDLGHWPRTAWAVMATITCRQCCVREIELRTGLPRDEIVATLAQLRKHEMLDRLVERRAVSRIDGHDVVGWRGFAARVGQLLGFAR